MSDERWAISDERSCFALLRKRLLSEPSGAMSVERGRVLNCYLPVCFHLLIIDKKLP